MKVDRIISGGRLINGSGNPWRYQDVLLAGDKIADVVPPGAVSLQGVERLDADGMFVCPGFIDIQSHSISSLMRDGRSVSKVTQGVTTEIMGEIWTPSPVGGCFQDSFAGPVAGEADDAWREQAREWKAFGDWLRTMERAGVSPNVGSFLSGSTLRQYAKGMSMSPASNAELEVMKRVMAEAMEDGAFGISYALIYPPDTYASTSEIIEIAKVAAQHHGIYITHMRSESAKILDGLEEAISIGREAGIPVEIYHLKASGRTAWDLMPEVIRRIETTRRSGQDVTANMYPYEATGTGFATCLPAWMAEDGNFYAKLEDPSIRRRIRDELEDTTSSYDGQLRSALPPNIMPVGFRLPENKEYVGMRLDEISRRRKTDFVDTICDLLVAEQRQISTIFFKMSPENTALQLSQPWVSISSDGPGVAPEWALADGPIHPRAYGTYPRVFRKYVREEGRLTWEEAVRKMTSAVADRLGLRKRGRIEPGYYADLVIFDPETITDRATFSAPHQLSLGVRDVFVNGTDVVKNGTHTGKTPGRFVRPG